jgi:hypothetical protein
MTDALAGIPMQPLQIAGRLYNFPTMNLLEEVDIIKTFFRVLVIVIGRYLRRSIFKLRGQHGFGPVDK